MADALRIEERLSEDVYDVLTDLIRYIKATRSPATLSIERLNTLRTIEAYGPLTIATLADIENVHPSTMSRMISGLAREELIRRVPDQEDGRGSLVMTTARGKRESEKALRTRLTELTIALSGLSGKDRVVLEKGLVVLRNALQSD